MRPLARLTAAFKQLGSDPLPQSGIWDLSWASLGIRTPTEEDFQKALQEAHKSSLVMGCVEYQIAGITSVPLVIVEGETIVRDDPVLDLLARPLPDIPGVDGSSLMAGWLESLALSGDAYGFPNMSRGGDLAEIQYIPHTAMEPVPDRNGHLSHYLYRVDGRQIRKNIEDVIHIRRYQDTRRTHHGRATISALGPEIYLDMEATRTVAAVMKNRGMPGGVIWPDSEESVISPQDLRTTRAYMRNEYAGDKRGNWLVLGRKMGVQLLTFDPRLLDMSRAHEQAEERVTAAFGYPASVVGYGAGLGQTRVGATLKEQERQAWQGGHIPAAGVVTKYLSNWFYPDRDRVLALDLTGVTALQEDVTDKVERLTQAVSGGWILVSTAKKELGYEVKPTDEVYLRKVGVQEVPYGTAQADMEAAVAERLRQNEPPEQDPPGNDPPENDPPEQE